MCLETDLYNWFYYVMFIFKKFLAQWEVTLTVPIPQVKMTKEQNTPQDEVEKKLFKKKKTFLK